MAETLGRLLTELGEKPSYDAAAQCSRCGYCEQVCPTYVATGKETHSPRGRNQLVRLMLEGKLADPKAAEEALSTCLLCGACQTACYGKVPTPDLVLEGRRALRDTHWLVRLVSRLMRERPAALARLLKLGYALKRWGLSRLGRPLLRALGLPVLAAMDEHVDESPARLLDESLAPLRGDEAKARWSYFAPCGPRYLFPRVGVATWKACTSLEGQGRFLENGCCGLLANNYGELDDARELARRNIARAETTEGPIVGDCSSCVAFLKSYPQLFLRAEDAPWRERAERFSGRVKDAIEVYAAAAGSLPREPGESRVVYHDSCRALNGQGLQDAPRKAVKAAAGERYREMPGADVCCGGAGAFAFVHDELSDEILRRKTGNAASVQAGTIVTSSTSCLIQLARGLKTYYPDAEVLHVSEFVAKALETRHGT